jgi:hypothetical protein
MSSCANIVNRLQSDVCLLKENWSYIELMAAILKMDQAIFLQSPLLVYLVPSTPNGIGIPLTIESSSSSSLTTTTYSGLIVLDPTGSENCVVFTTETLINFGQRTSTGFFEMTDTLPIIVVNADPSILPTLSYSNVVSALQSCASANDNHTVSCEAFEALNVFLRKNFGIKNLSPSIAACFYDYFNQTVNRVVEPVVEKEEPVVYLPVNETSRVKTEVSVILPTPTVNETSRVNTEISVVLPTPTVNETSTVQESVRERTLLTDLYETCAERAFPFEPFEPFEPLRDIFESDREIKVEKVKTNKPVEQVKTNKPVEQAPEIIVRHIEDSMTTTTTDSTTESSSNDAIEAKLRALLEATETSEVSRTE